LAGPVLTLDPERDTPEVLRRYAEIYDTDLPLGRCAI
jgi:hypothetical protein